MRNALLWCFAQSVRGFTDNKHTHHVLMCSPGGARSATSVSGLAASNCSPTAVRSQRRGRRGCAGAQGRRIAARGAGWYRLLLCGLWFLTERGRTDGRPACVLPACLPAYLYAAYQIICCLRLIDQSRQHPRWSWLVGTLTAGVPTCTYVPACACAHGVNPACVCSGIVQQEE